MKKISYLISASLLLLSILLIIYTFYKAHFFHQGLKNDYYTKYYFISSLLIILSIISFYLNHKIKINLTVIIFSLIVPLYTIEVLLVYSDYKDSYKHYAKKNNIKYDDRSVYEFYIDFKKDNKNAILTIPPYETYNKYTIQPFGGISYRPTVFCKEAGFYTYYDSDRYGFNNPDYEWDKKDIILIVGDSLAHGKCVFENQNLAGHLRNLIGSETLGIINLGQFGNGPLTELGSFLEYKEVLKPKIVIWSYYEGNDLKNLKNEINEKLLKNYLDKDGFNQNLITRQKEIDKFLLSELVDRENFQADITSKKIIDDIKKILRFNKIKKLIKSMNKKQIDDDREYAKTIPVFKDILKKMEIIALNENFKFYFLYNAHPIRIVDKKYLENGSLFNYNKVRELINSLNIPFIDLKNELFTKFRADEIYPGGKMLHHNEKGYFEIAKILSKYLAN